MEKDYQKLIRCIIEEMEIVIGPVARTQANNVAGLRINSKIIIKGNPEKILKELINRFKNLMGPVALTISKKGAKKALGKNPKIKLPEILR